MLLYKFFGNKQLVRYSQPSIDVHTIIDTVISNLYLIKEIDFVAIILPIITRARFPHKKYINNDSRYWMYDKNGQNQFPFPSKDLKVNSILFEGRGQISKETLRSNIESPMSRVKFKDFKNISDTMRLLSTNKAEVDSVNKVLYSLKEISKCPFYIMSWEDDLDSSIVDTKSVLTEGIGHWETMNDLYLRGDKNGAKGDSHWSEQMNIDVANYIIKKYPSHFKGNNNNEKSEDFYIF